MQKAFMPDENEQSLMFCHLARGLLRASNPPGFAVKSFTLIFRE